MLELLQIEQETIIFYLLRNDPCLLKELLNINRHLEGIP